MRDELKKILMGSIVTILSIIGFFSGVFIWKNNYDHVQFYLYMSIMGIIFLMGVFIISYGFKDLQCCNHNSTSAGRTNFVSTYNDSIINEEDDFN